jgi:hypothetical protein
VSVVILNFSLAYISRRHASHRTCILWACILQGAHISQGVRISGACLLYAYLLEACLYSFTSLPCAQDTGGENPCIDTKMFKASDCGRLGRQAAGHLWSALRVVKSCRKDCLAAKVPLEAKAAALHPEQYQSLLSKLSTKEAG